ncbi:MAG: hypothetical protein C4576_13360 [Desulfobacteraceae bacterium]|nr:MAG: hypothetical protein C4576_13360 [Desulfobacteraceae bacterium]
MSIAHSPSMKRENSRGRLVLRWLAVLPATSLAYLLVSMFIGQALLNLFPGSSYLRAEVPGTDGLVNALFIGKTVGCYFCVFAGAYTAPSRRVLVAILLTIIPLVLAIITIVAFVTTLSDSGISFFKGLSLVDWSHLEVIVGTALSICACVVIYKCTKDKGDSSEQRLAPDETTHG